VATTGGTAGAHGGAVAGEAPEWPSGGRRLAVNNPGGRGVDGEPISRDGKAREGRGGAHIGEGWLAVLGAVEEGVNRGRSSGEAWRWCGKCWGGAALL
jgi:hypothetical protein